MKRLISSYRIHGNVIGIKHSYFYSDVRLVKSKTNSKRDSCALNMVYLRFLVSSQ